MPAPLPPKDRFASASAPVNRRTARQPVRAEPVVPHASVRQRLARVQAQHRLGGSLSQRLHGRGGLRGTASGTGGAAGIAVAVGATVCTMGLLVAWLQQSAAVGVAAGTGACVVAAAGWWRWRRGAGQAAADDLPPLFDTAALAQLDEVLRQLASEVGEAHLQQLRGLADTLGRMAPLMRRVGVSEHFTQEDHFYVTECVRRYWPDTLQAYLQVPRSGRASPGAGTGQSADGSLGAQLAMLQQELGKREQGLVKASAEALAQQQRFLNAKGAQGPMR